MLTVKQIERLWAAKSHQRMVEIFLEMRPENSLRLRLEFARSLPAAALAILRLDELAQAHHPFVATLLRTILAGQEADGGWEDPMTTALCLRALLCSHGSGPAIDRGIEYLANLQKPDGLWPRIPMRRMPADPFVSAFILYHLGDDPCFQASNRVDDTVDWFDTHADTLDIETAKLWRTLSIRFRRPLMADAAAWS